MTKQNKLSYLAGFMDGEGTFAIVKTFSIQRKPDGSKKRYIVYKLNISICNTNKEVMDWITFNFGGKSLPGSNENRKPHYKTRYAWHVTHRDKQKNLILGLLPYLVAKKEQAKISLQFITTYSSKIGVQLDSAVVEKREQLRKSMMILNGTFVATDSKPVETTRETPRIEDDDIVSPIQRCIEAVRNESAFVRSM
jgi:hypothetical protein